MPGGLLTAITSKGERTDLVTIPPQTSEQAAWAAMQEAAEAGNREHAPPSWPPFTRRRATARSR